MPLDIVAERSFRNTLMRSDLLSAEEEYELAVKWRDERDEAALHRLIRAYMRLAISIAMKFSRYGVARSDLTQEAAIGLLKAAEKFDPDRGVRFSTYAQWWVKATVQSFVMRDYSLVRTGSTTNQKSLFFNYQRIKANVEREALKNGETYSSDEICKLVAEELGVPLRDAQIMEGRLSGGDLSLNAMQNNEDDSREWIETIPDNTPQAAEQFEQTALNEKLVDVISKAMTALSEREQFVISQRKLIEEPRTLQSIAQELNLSKERIRQVESAALEKLRRRLLSIYPQAAQLV
ncbi:MAG: RNA polymerase factor sigma-32 [Pseudomonadota bacterium]